MAQVVNLRQQWYDVAQVANLRQRGMDRCGTSCKLAPAKGDVAHVQNLRQQRKKEK